MRPKLFACVMFIVLAVFGSRELNASPAASLGSISFWDRPVFAAEEISPLRITLHLERVYLDGEKSEETVMETIWSMEDFWAKYDAWQLIEMEESELVFRQHVDDISPLLKTNGYFGLSDEGVLTIFNGRPDHTNIIQSFFQLDLGKLESTKREKLNQGIPIKSKDEYEKVLETYKPYTRIEKH